MISHNPNEIAERPASGFTEAEIATIDAARAILRGYARSTAPLQFRVLLLDRKNKLVRDRIMTRGSIDHVPVYVSEVIRSALVLDASALILCHSHPSGDPEPSQTNIELTRKIVEDCKVMEIVIHDHIIVGFGREKYAFSMRAVGMLSD